MSWTEVVAAVWLMHLDLGLVVGPGVEEKGKAVGWDQRRLGDAGPWPCGHSRSVCAARNHTDGSRNLLK